MSEVAEKRRKKKSGFGEERPAFGGTVTFGKWEAWFSLFGFLTLNFSLSRKAKGPWLFICCESSGNTEDVLMFRAEKTRHECRDVTEVRSYTC